MVLKKDDLIADRKTSIFADRWFTQRKCVCINGIYSRKKIGAYKNYECETNFNKISKTRLLWWHFGKNSIFIIYQKNYILAECKALWTVFTFDKIIFFVASEDQNLPKNLIFFIFLQIKNDFKYKYPGSLSITKSIYNYKKAIFKLSEDLEESVQSKIAAISAQDSSETNGNYS